MVVSKDLGSSHATLPRGEGGGGGGEGVTKDYNLQPTPLYKTLLGTSFYFAMCKYYPSPQTTYTTGNTDIHVYQDAVDMSK